MAGPARIPDGLRAWIEARRRHHLSHAQVQMARELGMNPTKLGKIDNHKQEPWKAPLPQFIEHLYFKRFGKERPELVRSIEEHAREQERKKAARTEAKRLKKASGGLPSFAGAITAKPREPGVADLPSARPAAGPDLRPGGLSSSTTAGREE